MFHVNRLLGHSVYLSFILQKAKIGSGHFLGMLLSLFIVAYNDSKVKKMLELTANEMKNPEKSCTVRFDS
jgi:hypothetical protein